MTDRNLSKSLSALRAPAPSDAAKERAHYHATVALQAAWAQGGGDPRGAAAGERRGFWRGIFTGLTLSACVVALAIGLFFERAKPGAGVAAEDLLAQLQQLFPGQLNAVIERNGALQLELVAAGAEPAGGARLPGDQAILVELTRGSQRLRVFSYSGHSVRLELDGVEKQFDTLLTGEGGIVLAGADFAWDSTAPRRWAGWKITARALGSI